MICGRKGRFIFWGRYCVSGEQHLFLQTLDRAHVPPVLAVHFLLEPPQKRSGFALGFFLNYIPFYWGRTRPKSYIVYGFFWGGGRRFCNFFYVFFSSPSRLYSEIDEWDFSEKADFVEVQALCRGEREIWDYNPIWVFPKIRGTPKWMVYNGKPY